MGFLDHTGALVTEDHQLHQISWYPNGMEKEGFVHEYPAWCHLPGIHLTSAAGCWAWECCTLYWAHASTCSVSPRACGQSTYLGARMGGSGGDGGGGGAHGGDDVHASGSQAPCSPRALAWEAGPVPLHAPPW